MWKYLWDYVSATDVEGVFFVKYFFENFKIITIQ